jgi:hypothetical protein
MANKGTKRHEERFIPARIGSSPVSCLVAIPEISFPPNLFSL